jgi:hypothetical protein
LGREDVEEYFLALNIAIHSFASALRSYLEKSPFGFGLFLRVQGRAVST